MKVVKYIAAFVLISLVTIGFAHAVIRPQQTRIMLIDWYDFNRDGNLYYRSDVDVQIIDSLKSIIAQAENRVGQFWGGYTSTPKIIYCHTKEDYQKFGNPAMTPAVAIMSFRAQVVIQPDGFNLDVIAHELSHTELFERIGFFNREQKIPVWFDEGLAMQVDWRENYSIDSLMLRSDNLTNLPDVETMKTYSQFGSGSDEDITMNYATSKYIVGKWLGSGDLKSFIDRINNGASFEEAFNNN